MPLSLAPELLDAILSLKHVDRAGWKRVGIGAPESVAAHAAGMGLLALALCPPELDRDRVLALCLLHDLPEAVVGDITPHDGVSAQDKADRERAAAARIFATRADLWGRWEDYEKDRSPEAHFVHQLDKLDMALQALRYAAERGADTTEFVASARARLTDPRLIAVLDAAQGA
ncbi:MAG: HD domain-containing protein [Alphaproteobacteria bacterium]|nr:HD domain-containing protein [Alphaproteobacteria bacterium]